jgi:hypothetical protein
LVKVFDDKGDSKPEIAGVAEELEFEGKAVKGVAVEFEEEEVAEVKDEQSDGSAIWVLHVHEEDREGHLEGQLDEPVESYLVGEHEAGIAVERVAVPLDAEDCELDEGGGEHDAGHQNVEVVYAVITAGDAAGLAEEDVDAGLDDVDRADAVVGREDE